MADNSNPGNFANRPQEDVTAAAKKGGQSSHQGGFANMDPDKQVCWRWVGVLNLGRIFTNYVEGHRVPRWKGVRWFLWTWQWGGEGSGPQGRIYVLEKLEMKWVKKGRCSEICRKSGVEKQWWAKVKEDACNNIQYNKNRLLWLMRSYPNLAILKGCNVWEYFAFWLPI